MSRIATRTLLLINFLTTSSPIPEHPPVTTATSRFQFHLALSLRSLPEFRATWFSCLFRTFAAPNARHTFNAFTIRAYCVGSRRAGILVVSWRRSCRGPFVSIHKRAVVTMGLSATRLADVATRLTKFCSAADMTVEHADDGWGLAMGPMWIYSGSHWHSLSNDKSSADPAASRGGKVTRECQA